MHRDIYRSGAYFEARVHESKGDAPWKSQEVLRVFVPWSAAAGFRVNSLIDVGCGSGDAVAQVCDGLRAQGHPVKVVKGYDVSPGIRKVKQTHKNVQFVQGDFCKSEENVDVVMLLDVVEHVIDPLGFLKSVGSHCKVLIIHFPLENHLSAALRNKFARGAPPEHLLVLDAPAAVNLVAFAGLRIETWAYTLAFKSPYQRTRSLPRVFVYPFRYILGLVSPYLLAKTIGGVSLLLVARSSSFGQTK